MTNKDLSYLLINEKDKKNIDFKCLVCKSLLIPKNTIQLECSHIFCHSCILKNININQSSKCPLCFKHFNHYNKISISNIFAYNILSNLLIKCPHKGCKKIILLGDLDLHIQKCEYRLVDCPYCFKKNLIKKEFKNHLVDNMEEHFLGLIEEVEKLKNKFNYK